MLAYNPADLFCNTNVHHDNMKTSLKYTYVWSVCKEASLESYGSCQQIDSKPLEKNNYICVHTKYNLQEIFLLIWIMGNKNVSKEWLCKV